jgi:hypothetical protein
MTFHVVSIQHPTPRVLGKLRKGGRVRICHGTGMNLIVSANKFNPISKSFGKGKAYTVELTPAEIQANLNPPEELVPHVSGTGLFDSLKKGVKNVGKVLAPVAKEVGKVLLPTAKKITKEAVDKAATYAPEIGATLGSSALSGLALMAGQPELVPLAVATGASFGSQAGKTLGNYGKNQLHQKIDSFEPFNKEPPSRLVASTILNQPLAQANVGNYLANLSLADLEGMIAQKRMSQGVAPSSPFDYSGGKQVLAPYTDAVGKGLYAGAHRGGNLPIRRSNKMIEKSSIGIHGNLLGYGLPPALMSQPYGANFQWSSRLPPAFQVLNKGSGMYV